MIALAILIVAAPAAWLRARPASDDGAALVATVKQGDFAVTVTTAGELRASASVQIQGPPEMQRAGAFQEKIASLVPEGTIVKEGDVVAELDRSSLAQRLQETTLAVQKAEAVTEQAMLDSTLNLSTAREGIRTMEAALEEKQIAKDQAIYEAPTIKRQAEIDYEKAVRALAQAKLDYKTKVEQAQAKMREVGADLQRQKNQLQVVQTVMGQFTIKAPAPGMVIYQKEWNGKKRIVGSQVGAWDPTVATLPDLTKMESITYVNEIDIRKVAVGQPVTISLDSDPTKKLIGKVVAVANVGEQRPNTDAKVFEVKVLLSAPDTTLRPGMTTGNAIQTTELKDVLSVPLEAVSSVADVPYVYKRNGGRVTRQEVQTGAMNDLDVVIEAGLELGDEVLLMPPADADKLEPVRLPGSTAGTPKGGDSAIAPKTIPTPEPAAPEKAAPGKAAPRGD
jgi:RND family efflux transporter MFP subunit